MQIGWIERNHGDGKAGSGWLTGAIWDYKIFIRGFAYMYISATVYSRLLPEIIPVASRRVSLKRRYRGGARARCISSLPAPHIRLLSTRHVSLCYFANSKLRSPTVSTDGIARTNRMNRCIGNSAPVEIRALRAVVIDFVGDISRYGFCVDRMKGKR